MDGISFDTTRIPGLRVIQPKALSDNRGVFTKTFTAEAFSREALATRFAEEYHTSSKRGVIRGMHLQLPPHAHDKIVFCVFGRVFDVVLDLRVGSPAFGLAEVFELSGPMGHGLYIPSGCAHGFCALEDDSVLTYKVTTGYAPESDAGVLWSSVPVMWPADNPVTSERDAGFPALCDFVSPFSFDGGDVR